MATFMVSMGTMGITANASEVEKDKRGKPLILDMDFGSDVDDACALRLAVNSHLADEVSLKAVTFSVLGASDENIIAADGMLDYQGVHDIPFGRCSVDVYDTSPYWEVLTQYSDKEYTVEDAVKLWRKIISTSETTVDICTTGYLMNLTEFCKSQPDEISDKSGLELLNTKVGDVYITGGAWESGLDNNFFFYEEAKQSLAWLLENVDKELIFVSSDVGGPVQCGKEVVQEDRSDALSQALITWGTDTGRAAWDPMATYISILGKDKETLNKSNLDIMNVDMTFDGNSGVNTFIINKQGKHKRVYRLSNDMKYYSRILDSRCLKGYSKLATEG